MSLETLKRRIAKLEPIAEEPIESPPFILVQVVDATKCGDAQVPAKDRRAAIAAVQIEGNLVVRDAEEGVGALCRRAAALHPGHGVVPVVVGVSLSQMPAAGGVQ